MNEPLLQAPETALHDCASQLGAVCWRMHRGRVEVLLITSRDTGRWVIPKGWPMTDRSHAEAAAQEAWEEAGVQGEIAALPIGAFRYAKVLSAKKALDCEVTVFGLRVKGLKDQFPERKQRRRKWFAAPKAARKVQEPGLRELFLMLDHQLAANAPGASDSTPTA